MKIKVKIKQKLNNWLKNLRDTHVWNSSSSQFIPFDRLRYLEKYFLILNWYLKRIINDSPFTKRLIDRSAPCFRFIGKQLRLMALFRNIKSSVHNEGVREKKLVTVNTGKMSRIESQHGDKLPASIWRWLTDVVVVRQRYYVYTRYTRVWTRRSSLDR